jgi:flavin reductase (DIM6/NTAB) family NADH-FMN oxidoreductase RutF
MLKIAAMTQASRADGQAYREAMRTVPSAVAVVTAEHDGLRRGLTATAVCSVSADPPQVLACVNKSGSTHATIAEAGRFGINYLAQSQESVARVFSQAQDEPTKRFQSNDWCSGAEGVPLLREALASFACRVVQQIDCGTHTIFVGEVLEIHQQDQSSLLYKDGAFLHA